MAEYRDESDDESLLGDLFPRTYFINSIPKEELENIIQRGNKITFALEKKHNLCQCEDGNFRLCECINERGEKGNSDLLEDRLIVTITDLKLENITNRNAIEMLIELKYNIFGVDYYFLEGFKKRCDDIIGVYFELVIGT